MSVSTPRFYYEPMQPANRRSLNPTSYHVLDRLRPTAPDTTVAICHQREDADRIVQALNGVEKLKAFIDGQTGGR